MAAVAFLTPARNTVAQRLLVGMRVVTQQSLAVRVLAVVAQAVLALLMEQRERVQATRFRQVRRRLTVPVALR